MNPLGICWRKLLTAQGQRCGNRDCAGRLHDHCMRNFFRMQQAEQCPVCQAPWPGDKFVGERAITSTERHVQARRQVTNTQRQSDVGSSTQIPSEDGAADSD